MTLTVSAHDARGTAIGFAASSLAVKRVRPLCVFAAGRKRFEVEIDTKAEFVAIERVLDALPLHEHGWTSVKATHLGGSLWLIERGA